MEISNLICIKQTEFKNDELVLTTPLTEIELPSIPIDISFEIVFSYTGWSKEEINMLRIVMKDETDNEVFDSDYIEVPLPNRDVKVGLLGIKLNDFTFKKVGKYIVKVIENEHEIAKAFFVVSVSE